jgi:23S rRNA pseudouridine2605 synthase
MSRKYPGRKPPRRTRRPHESGSAPKEEEQSLRLQAYLARAGVASRRGSEELIREGRVTVNGQAAELGMKVDPASDTVRVDRRVVSPLAMEWIALNKPRGYVTTRDDPGGRKTIYDLLPPELHHLFHVGRLDRDSSGLLLLTNDGDTANQLLHPRYGTLKEYRVDVEGRPDSATMRDIVEGVQLEDGVARAVTADVRAELDDGIYRLRIVLEEGRNREVRRMLEAVGHPVRRLFRISFGPIEVGRLKTGAWRRLTGAEVASLRRKEAEERGR